MNVRKLIYAVCLICIGITLFLMLAPLNSGRFSGRGKSPLVAATVNKAMVFSYCIELYKQRFGEYPTGENAVIVKKLAGNNPRGELIFEPLSGATNQLGEVVDAWGTPFRFVITGTNQCSVESAGPNTKFDDKDDVVVPIAQEGSRNR